MTTYKIQSNNRKVSLSNKDYVAEGGEGTIYTQGGLAYKVCFPGKMMPEGKIAELLPLAKRDHIIVPNDILLDSKDKQVGYVMNFVPNNKSYPLVQTFTNAFKKREGLNVDSTLKLIDFMRDNIQFIHDNNVLVVDMNEFNFLVDKSFDKVYFIDTNSYQTKSYKATAIMESIRDRHTKGFNKLSDWFSFGVLTFQMMTGLHPYRSGYHPDFHGSIDEFMDARMKRNASVLHPKATYPKIAVDNIKYIPQNYMEWYKSIFEKGLRVEPPKDFVGLIIIPQKINVITDGVVKLLLYKEFNSSINHYFYTGGVEFFTEGLTLHYNGRKCVLPHSMKIVYLKNKPIGIYVKDGFVKFWDVIGETPLEYRGFNLQCSNLMVYNNRVYCQCEERVVEILFNEIGDNLIPSPHIVSNCSTYSTKFLDGLICQEWFGTNFISIFPNSKESYQFNIKELSKHVVIDGKFIRHTAIISSRVGSKFYRHTIKFNENFSQYIINSILTNSIYDVNFTELDNGVCILLNENGDLELFSSRMDSTTIKVITDKVVSQDIKLYSKGSKVLMVIGNKVYEGSMK